MSSIREQLVNLGFTDSTPPLTRDENILSLIDKEGLTKLYEEMYLPMVINMIEGACEPTGPYRWERRLMALHHDVTAGAFVDAYPLWEELL